MSSKNTLSRRSFLKVLGLLAGVTALGPGIGCGQAPIRIGVMGPMAISVGIGIRDGAMLAAEEINKAGGILGQLIELVFADDQNKPEVGASAFENLVVNNGCKAVVGPFRTEVVGAIAELIPYLRVPLLITGATYPGHTARVAKDYDNYKYIFRLMLNGIFLAVNLLEFSKEYLSGQLVAKGILPNNKVAVVAEDLLWTKPITDMLGAMLPKMGLEVVAIEQTAVGIPSFAPIFDKIAKAGATATIMVFSEEPTDGILFAYEWKMSKVPTALFGINTAFHSPKTAMLPAAAYIVEMELGAGLVEIALTAKTIHFLKAYSQRFPENPVPVDTSFISYDSIYMLAEAIRRAGTTEADPIVAELEKLEWVGALGNFKFYGLNPAAEDPVYGKYAFPHDSRYGWDWVYPNHVQIGEKGEKCVIWPERGKEACPYLLPPWMR